jgi:uncharacterized protein (DUF58 family)
MLPLVTVRTRALLLGCFGIWTLAIVTHSWMAAMLGSAMAVMLGAAFAATLPLGRRVRAQRLEFAWWLRPKGSAAHGVAVPNQPFQVHCYVRHRGTDAVELRSLMPLRSANAELVETPRGRLMVSPESRTEFVFTLRASAPGRAFLHGLSVGLRGPMGLFEVPLYFPNALSIKVFPHVVSVPIRRAGPARARPQERPSHVRRYARGGGTDLHELREQVPGDPFKSIAWKASARRGQLMVREVEQEEQETRMLVVDVGASLRNGPPGARALDRIIEVASATAHACIDAGDRVGLVCVDGRVVSQVKPGEGPTHLLRLVDALLASIDPVDADLTQVDDAEVATLVARYIRHQDGLEFSAQGTRNVDVAALSRHATSVLPVRTHDLPVAGGPLFAELRRFCRERGIPLAHRLQAEGGDKARALADALRVAVGPTRAARSILCFTDLTGIVDWDVLTRSARALQRNGHRISMRVVPPPAATDAAATQLVLAVAQLRARSHARRVKEARAHLGRLGIDVEPCLTGPRKPAQIAAAAG